MESELDRDGGSGGSRSGQDEPWRKPQERRLQGPASYQPAGAQPSSERARSTGMRSSCACAGTATVCQR
jgi:hypothetical protein